MSYAIKCLFLMLEFILQHLDYLSSAMSLFGYWRLSKLATDGWIWSFCGNAVLIVWSVYNEPAYGLIAGNLAYIVIKLFSYVKWRKDEVGQ